jgi:hypothetical protein
MVGGGRLSIPSAAALLVMTARATATPTITFFIPGFLWSGTQHANAALEAVLSVVKPICEARRQTIGTGLGSARALCVRECRCNCKRDGQQAGAFGVRMQQCSNFAIE